MSGLRFARRARAASLFGVTTSLVPNVTWRCRFIGPLGMTKLAGHGDCGGRNSDYDGGNTARDRRNDADGVAILRWRILFRQVANVFIVHVNVDEAAQLAIFGEEMFAQVREFRSEMAKRFPHGASAELGRIAFPRVGAKRRWNHYFHGHFIFSENREEKSPV